MAITINKRPSWGDEVIFTSETAKTVAKAIKEMGYRPNLTGANLTGADITGADITGADLTGAIAPWQSHDFIAEALRQSAGDDIQKRMVAGLILVSRDWCWKKFAALDIAPELKDWAFRTLSAWAWKIDPEVPNELADWMDKNGVARLVRPKAAVAA